MLISTGFLLTWHKQIGTIKMSKQFLASLKPAKMLWGINPFQFVVALASISWGMGLARFLGTSVMFPFFPNILDAQGIITVAIYAMSKSVSSKVDPILLGLGSLTFGIAIKFGFYLDKMVYFPIWPNIIDVMVLISLGMYIMMKAIVERKRKVVVPVMHEHPFNDGLQVK